MYGRQVVRRGSDFERGDVVLFDVRRARLLSRLPELLGIQRHRILALRFGSDKGWD